LQAIPGKLKVELTKHIKEQSFQLNGIMKELLLPLEVKMEISKFGQKMEHLDLN
jgi:hypothetical protein